MAEIDDRRGALAHVTSVMEDDVMIIKITGELDISSVPNVERKCSALIGSASGQVVFDLATLEYIDSSGLAVLLRAAQTAPVVVRNTSDVLRRIFAATGLTEVLHVES